MLMNPVRDEQVAKLLRDHLFGMGAEDEMHFVRRGIDLIEQTLQIDRAAGAGSGNDKFHGFSICRPVAW
jgi:hypothetical protein